MRRATNAALLAGTLAAVVAGTSGWWLGREKAAQRTAFVEASAVPGGSAPGSVLSLPPLADRPVRHVVLMVADGMGIAHTAVARIDAFGGARASGADAALDAFIFQRFPVTGLITTHPGNGWVGSSDSGATALFTGAKTLNGRIGVDSTGKSLPNLREIARTGGRLTGVVSTSQVWDATPAALLAHVDDRGDWAAILDQAAGSGVDFLAGGGREQFLPESAGGKRKDGRDLLAEAGARHVHVVTDLASFETLDASQRPPVWALFPGKRLGEEPVHPDVSDLAAKALAVLAAEADRRSTGFFLMIEEEGVDTASHVNDLDRLTAAALRFDRAVDHAARFAAERGDTLVVVVSDHATGGITIDHQSEPGRLRVVWTSIKHTGEPVAVYAYGPESAARTFAGSYDNTGVFERVARFLGSSPALN